MSITLKQLRYLAALAEEGHSAAAAVNVSQPALSVQIREPRPRWERRSSSAAGARW